MSNAEKRFSLSPAVINQIRNVLGQLPYNQIAGVMEALRVDLKEVEQCKLPHVPAIVTEGLPTETSKKGKNKKEG